MSKFVRIGSLVTVAAVCLSIAGFAQTQVQAPATKKTAHAAKKKSPNPLPSGPLGPLPQFPLETMPAVQPHVSFQDGQLTIDTPNSTLGDVLRAVHSQTLADMEVPPGATDRVALHLGPGPAREVVATLLNGSKFNYVLLGAPGDPQKLTRIVLVAKAAEAPAPGQSAAQANRPGTNQPANNQQADPPQEETAENAADDADNADDQADQQPAQTADTQQQQPPQQPNGTDQMRTPAQMLQEMQQRQMQMMQQIQQQQQNNGGQAQPPVPNPPAPQQ